MKRILAGILSTALLCSVAACAKPTTMNPMGSQAEIQREAQQQTTYVKGQQKVDLESLGDLSAQAVQPYVQNVASRIVPTSEQLCRELRINDLMNCAYKISIIAGKKNAQGVVEPDTSLNAYADGTSVHISPAMVRFANKESELGLILAHEFAHNIMRHVDGKKQNALLGTLLGVAADMAASSQGFDSGGQFGKLGMGIGANAYSPAFETEADYIGLYILARAGYDYHNAPAFWRRMSVENPQAIYTGRTHPSNAERYVNMNKVIAEIDYKKSNNLPLIPEFQQR